MKKTEIVWRTLADSALAGAREWPDLRALAAAADVPVSSTHQAIQRLADIGALSTQHRGGITVRSPEKLLTYLAAHRNLSADVVARTTLAAAQNLLDEFPSAVSLGGTDAAVHWLGDRNTISDKGIRVIYVDLDAGPFTFPEGNEALIVARDSTAGAAWHEGYSSRAQTFADLFALPGWQASEFRHALQAVLLPSADWNQPESENA